MKAPVYTIAQTRFVLDKAALLLTRMPCERGRDSCLALAQGAADVVDQHRALQRACHRCRACWHATQAFNAVTEALRAAKEKQS